MSNRLVLGSSYSVEHVSILSVFMLLSIIALALRFWARRIQKSSLELNDYIIVIGSVSSYMLRNLSWSPDVYQVFTLGGAAFNIYGRSSHQLLSTIVG